METRLMCHCFISRTYTFFGLIMVLINICRNYIMEKYYSLIEKKGKRKISPLSKKTVIHAK